MEICLTKFGRRGKDHFWLQQGQAMLKLKIFGGKVFPASGQSGPDSLSGIRHQVRRSKVETSNQKSYL